MVGDGTIVARMTAAALSDGWPDYSDAGIMVRTGPTPTAAMMFVGIERGTVLSRWRTDTGLQTGSATGAAIGTPYWFKLVRAGSTVAAFASPDGVTWTQIGTTQTLNIAVGSTMYAGLTVAGTSGASTATFDNVNVF
jgi:hypothetical protein